MDLSTLVTTYSERESLAWGASFPRPTQFSLPILLPLGPTVPLNPCGCGLQVGLVPVGYRPGRASPAPGVLGSMSARRPFAAEAAFWLAAEAS